MIKFHSDFHGKYVDLGFYDKYSTHLLGIQGNLIATPIIASERNEIILKNPGIFNNNLKVDLGLKDNIKDISYSLIETNILDISTAEKSNISGISGIILPEIKINNGR